LPTCNKRSLSASPETKAVVGRGRHEERRADRRRLQRPEVQDALRARELAEPAGERHGEQEREEHLHAGERHAELVEQLDQLAVEALLGILSFLGAVGPLCNRDLPLCRFVRHVYRVEGGAKLERLR